MTTIEVRELTKRYGSETVVDDLSFTVEPGHVTGFLGPNGAGKSTTMRVILGLAPPTRGSVRVGGREFGQLPVPLTEVGALLDAGALHPGRRAEDHLLAVALATALDASGWPRYWAWWGWRRWPAGGPDLLRRHAQ